MTVRHKITPFLWFDGRAEEAMYFYLSLFENSEALDISRYGDGSVISVTFELDGQKFMALNGGTHFTFNPAVSFFVDCETQEEVDRLWDALCEGGEPGQCGWLTDKFGLSWQIIPRALGELLGGPDPAKSSAAMQAMMQMTKIDVAGLQAAYDSAA